MLIIGILGGGAAGVREGFMKAPNRRSRVLLNSVMNHAGKKGSMYGNTLGVLGEVGSGSVRTVSKLSRFFFVVHVCVANETRFWWQKIRRT